MKKIIVLGIVLTLALAAISVITTSTAHTEDNPQVVTLWAGQNIDAGTVSVWNDGDNIYVTFETTGDWVITETHLYVGKTDPNGLTSAPGQFPYSEDHDPPETMVPYVIALDDIDGYHLKLNKKGNPTGVWEADGTPGVGPDDTVYIADHAVVVSPIGDCYEVVWQIGDVETDGCSGDLTNYANEFNWVQDLDGDGVYTDPVGDCENGPGLGANEPTYTNPFIVGTTPDNEFPYNSNAGRPYATNFDVQWGGELLFGGMLTVSWSPGRSYPTETKVLNGDGMPADTTFVQAGTTQSGQGYFLDIYPVYQDSVAVDLLSDGTHTINFQHTAGDGTFWDWIILEKSCEQWETAWGEGDPFGNNWAMYFTYDIQGWELLETVTVPADDTPIVTSTTTFDSGTLYKIVASGTAFAGDTIDFDAKYSITNRIVGDTWTDSVSGYESYGPTLLDLMVNGGFVDWGTYNSNHIYEYITTGTGTPVNFQFQIYDIYPPNNGGSLTVDIYKWA